MSEVKPKLVMLQYQGKRSKAMGEKAGPEMYSIHAVGCKDLTRDKRDHDAFERPVDNLEKTIEENKYAGLKVHPCCKAGKLTGYHEGSED